MHSDDGWLINDDAAPGHMDKRIRRAQVYGDIIRKSGRYTQLHCPLAHSGGPPITYTKLKTQPCPVS
jgi:hypothetical protein